MPNITLGNVTVPIVPNEPVAWTNDMWYITILVTAILAIIGNVAITWIVWAHRSMKTITNVYIGNMGIGGLFITLIAFPFIFPYASYPAVWQMPGFCVMYEFGTSIGICVFVFSLMMMSVEKYYAIAKPNEDMPSIRYRPTFNIWFFSFIITLPTLWLSSFVLINENSGQHIGVCLKIWPPFLGGYRAAFIYSFILAVLSYFVPVGVMTYRNVQLGKILWGRKSVEPCEIDKEAQKQTVKMMILQMIVFALLWLPHSILVLLVMENSDSSMGTYLDGIYIVCYWLALISVVLYPIIYVCMEDRFQKKLKKVFRWCPCVDYESKSLNYALGHSNKEESSAKIEESYRVLSDV